MTRTYERMLREKLRALRKSRGLTQEKLAEALGTDPHYISAIENGKRGIGKELLGRYYEFFELNEEEQKQLVPMDNRGGNTYPPLVQMFVARLKDLPESEQAQVYSDLLRYLENRKITS